MSSFQSVVVIPFGGFRNWEDMVFHLNCFPSKGFQFPHLKKGFHGNFLIWFGFATCSGRTGFSYLDIDSCFEGFS